jgi:hypothetical protein
MVDGLLNGNNALDLVAAAKLNSSHCPFDDMTYNGFAQIPPNLARFG